MQPVKVRAGFWDGGRWRRGDRARLPGAVAPRLCVPRRRAAVPPWVPGPAAFWDAIRWKPEDRAARRPAAVALRLRVPLRRPVSLPQARPAQQQAEQPTWVCQERERGLARHQHLLREPEWAPHQRQQNPWTVDPKMDRATESCLTDRCNGGVASSRRSGPEHAPAARTRAAQATR